MKQLLLLILVFSFLNSIAQDKEFFLQGQIVDAKHNPISDVYLFNPRNSIKTISRSNGVFDIWVLPADSVIISHISFLRKTVTVYQLMVNPIIQLEIDTVNIRPVNVSASQRTDYEKAMKNIESIEFDFRTKPDDSFTETERMKLLMQKEDQVQRVAASSVSLVRFSPSAEINKILAKHRKKKETKQFSSTKESETKGEK
jgi:translation initiation factor IF-1